MFKPILALIACVFIFFSLQGILESLDKSGYSNEHPAIFLSLHSLYFAICYFAYIFSKDLEIANFKDIK